MRLLPCCWSLLLALVLLTTGESSAFAQHSRVKLSLKDGELIEGKLLKSTPEGNQILSGDQVLNVPKGRVASMEVCRSQEEAENACDTLELKARKNTTTASFNAQADVTVSSVPARPARRGLGLVITGWSVFGAGALVSAGTGAASGLWSSTGPDASNTMLAVSLTAGAIGLGGLTMAIIGHFKRSDSLGEQQRWDEKYRHLGQQNSFEIVPMFGPEGGQLLVSARF